MLRPSWVTLAARAAPPPGNPPADVPVPRAPSRSPPSPLGQPWPPRPLGPSKPPLLPAPPPLGPLLAPLRPPATFLRRPGAPRPPPWPPLPVEPEPELVRAELAFPTPPSHPAVNRDEHVHVSVFDLWTSCP
ncbi:vegetative cell wall protein gp1-like [Ananas comosus]|uniref:Vegetative cell wall protein gp1-like n=1 Tax=Ananas comosus TaxID=4615 RepID=A0A6P5FA68_ANACO|nr:vegetative cell wall protein gp1-like [Ananas comosus]